MLNLATLRRGKAMVDQEKITLAARIGALELIVARVLALQTIEFSDAQFDEVTRGWASYADALIIGKISPVEPDLWAAALGDALQELLQLSRERRQGWI
jgi:hypothetical protein